MSKKDSKKKKKRGRPSSKNTTKNIIPKEWKEKQKIVINECANYYNNKCLFDNVCKIFKMEECKYFEDCVDQTQLKVKGVK